MYITYHKEITMPDKVKDCFIPHEILMQEIKEYIKDKKGVQEVYNCGYNGYSFFIYLQNGDRIDCRFE